MPLSHDPTITLHALHRAKQRFNPRGSARDWLRRAYRNSTALPDRYARVLLGKWALSKRRKGGTSYRVHANTLLVCRRSTIITAIRLRADQAAAVLRWLEGDSWNSAMEMVR